MDTYTYIIVRTKWERIEDSVGLIANATKDGSEVENDFDNIYPWSDIITYNYNDVVIRDLEVFTPIWYMDTYTYIIVLTCIGDFIF